MIIRNFALISLCSILLLQQNAFGNIDIDSLIQNNPSASGVQYLADRNHDYDDGTIKLLAEIYTSLDCQVIHQYDLPNSIKNVTDQLHNNKKYITACVAINNHARALVGHEDNGHKIFVYNDPYGTAIDQNLKQQLEAQGGQVIDLNLRKQPDSNSCGAYSVDFITEILRAMQNGKKTKEEIIQFINELNKDWSPEAIRARHYKLIYNQDPQWLGKQTTPSETKKQDEPKKSTPEQQTPTSEAPKSEQKESPTQSKNVDLDSTNESKIESFAESVKEEGYAILLHEKTADILEKHLQDTKKLTQDAQLQNVAPQAMLLIEQDQKLAEGYIIIYQQAQQQVAQLLIQEVSNILLSRISSTISPQTIGISSGSPFEKFGFWGQGFGGYATQKENANNKDAYSAKSMGFATGFDWGNENYTFGIAYNFASSNLVFDSKRDLINQHISNLLNLYASISPISKMHIAAQFGGGVGALEMQDKRKKLGKIFFGSGEVKYYLHILNKVSLFPKLGLEIFKSTYVSDKPSPLTDNADFEANRVIGLFAIGIKHFIDSGNITISPEFSLGAEINLFGEENKILNKSHIPAQALNIKQDGKITMVAQGKIDINTISGFTSSAGFKYRSKKDFKSIDGFVKLSLNF
jgi:hypothetical protein